jgi:hypothetical protein
LDVERRVARRYHRGKKIGTLVCDGIATLGSSSGALAPLGGKLARGLIETFRRQGDIRHATSGDV